MSPLSYGPFILHLSDGSFYVNLIYSPQIDILTDDVSQQNAAHYYLNDCRFRLVYIKYTDTLYVTYTSIRFMLPFICNIFVLNFYDFVINDTIIFLSNIWSKMEVSLQSW